MFARIVPRYDLMNRLMTCWQDVRWRRLAAGTARPAGGLALDIATGTGDLAIELLHRGARRVVAADYCMPMLDATRRKLERSSLEGIRMVAADALALPYVDQSFDCVTSGFLLRNVVDLQKCLTEIYRVLRPGGRAVALDLTHVPPSLAARAVMAYFRYVVPRLGRLVSGEEAAYRYLPASLERFPEADGLAVMFREAGFADVGFQRYALGAIAIHVATKPVA